MYNSKLKYAAALLLLTVLFSCANKSSNDQQVVASVGEKNLLLSDVNEFVPSELGEHDSTLMAEDYIKKWIRQELLIQKANENLTLQQKDLTREIEDYRNSLIIYKYKNELMREKMDTLVSKKQIEEYYNDNTDNFNLTRIIVKAVYVKIPFEVANRNHLKKLINYRTEAELNELREYCIRYAKGFDIFANNWIDFELLKKNIPLQIDDDEQFITKNSLIEVRDEEFYYLVKINDYRLKNDPAPLSFVENNIKNLILNQRKIEFLKDIEENVYTEGLRRNKFKIYNLNSNETK